MGAECVAQISAVQQQLDDVAVRACALTGASGAAIALRVSEDMVTVASSGASAPDVGVPVRTKGSFAGICAQTGEIQICNDTSYDERVDAAACQALDIRSMVVTPVKAGQETVGVLAVFAAKPEWFGEARVTLIRVLADIIAELVRPGAAAAAHARRAPEPPAVASKAPPEARPENLAEIAALAEQELPSVLDVARSNTVVHILPALEKPAAEEKRAAAPAVVPKPAPKPMAQVPPKRRPEPSQPEILPMASDPCAEGTVVKAAEPPPEFLFSSLNPPLPEQSRGWQKYAFLAAAAVVLAVGAWMLHGRAVRAAKDRAAVSAPPASVESASVPSPAPPTPEPAAKAVVPDAPKTASTAPAAGDAAKAKDSKTATKESKTTEKDSKSGESAAAKAEKAEVLVVKPSSARPNASPEETEDAPPAATFASAKTPPMVSVSKPYIPNAPALKTAELIPPQLIKSVAPAYPEVAKRNRFQSTVVLNARITKDGTLDQIQVVRGMTVFHPAAINAVKQWRYKPAYLDGQPVDSTIEIKMEFSAH